MKKTKAINIVEIEKDRSIIHSLTPKLLNKELEESIVKLGLSIKKENK